MTQELSKSLITHKLVINWIGTKYIDKDFATYIFNQLNDKNQKVIIISNPETLTYFQKYKNEIELLPLDKNSKDFEDILFMSWLSEEKKQEVREILQQRKSDKKPITETIIRNIINSL